MTDKSEERLKLEGQANRLGLKYPANIGDEKLAEKIKAAERDPQGGGAIVEKQIPASQQEAPSPTLRITGPKRGRWRIGRKFTPEAIDLAVSELEPKDIKAILDDPLLTVVGIGASVDELIDAI